MSAKIDSESRIDKILFSKSFYTFLSCKDSHSNLDSYRSYHVQTGICPHNCNTPKEKSFCKAQSCTWSFEVPKWSTLSFRQSCQLPWRHDQGNVKDHNVHKWSLGTWVGMSIDLNYESLSWKIELSLASFIPLLLILFIYRGTIINCVLIPFDIIYYKDLLKPI